MKMGVAGTFFEPHLWNSGNLSLFSRCKNHITIIFLFILLFKSCKKCWSLPLQVFRALWINAVMLLPRMHSSCPRIRLGVICLLSSGLDKPFTSLMFNIFLRISNLISQSCVSGLKSSYFIRMNSPVYRHMKAKR